ncbi:hypothetical protein MC885_012548 [Smutsia gigantea]|nr:hypothetical protein MC885_012548 [Smutsia gigantea]
MRAGLVSGRKKKITKAERLKQLQEEEERRQKEEEETRLKHEKEEMERLEIQRIENEKWQQLEAKDLERRNEELEELYFLEGCFPEAEKLKRETRLLSQWEHYVRCDGRPDPSVPQEINTFISLWKEETNETFENVIVKSKLVLRLIDKLKLTLLETPLYDLQSKNIQYQGSILELQELLYLKFNKATEILLRQASALADLDSGNMEKIIQDETVTLHVWANLKKNPRYRSVRFSETQTGFEIPRILATSDIALRLLHTHYDHVTPLNLVPASLQKHTSIVSPLVKEEIKNVDAVISKEFQEESKQENESNSVHEEEINMEEQGETEVQMSSVQEECEATKCDLEMKLLTQLLLIENVPEKPYYFEDNEVDLYQFTTLGGVYHLDILELPPQCKPMKGWMLVEILKEGLQKYTYPPETTEEYDTENAFPPIKVTLEVQKNVIFFEDPKVARWDAEGKHWKTDGISSVYYKSEERLITFSLETFGPVTLLQETHINMPFQSWELTPLDGSKVLLTVTTVFTELQIQIKENLCMLASIKLNDKKHSSILEGIWMTPLSFIIALKEVGLNIFPTGHSHFYVVINHKVREHLTKEEPIQNPDWALLMFSGERAQRLRIDEYSEVFSETLKEGSEFHSTLYHMVKDFASKEAMEKIRNSNCQLIDSVCHMLFSTRLLSYS